MGIHFLGNHWYWIRLPLLEKEEEWKQGVV